MKTNIQTQARTMAERIEHDGQLYSISYNGRVWDAATGAEVPMPGRKTCAQHDADGWKDFRL